MTERALSIRGKVAEAIASSCLLGGHMERKLDWSVVSTTIKWSRIPLSSYTFFLRLLLTSADMNLIEGCNVNVSSGERNAPNYDWHHRLVSFDMHKQEISFLSFALFFVLWVVFIAAIGRQHVQGMPSFCGLFTFIYWADAKGTISSVLNFF